LIEHFKANNPVHGFNGIGNLRQLAGSRNFLYRFGNAHFDYLLSGGSAHAII
jgi:hypothetical protein